MGVKGHALRKAAVISCLQGHSWRRVPRPSASPGPGRRGPRAATRATGRGRGGASPGRDPGKGKETGRGPPPGWPGRGTSARGDAGRAHAPAPLTRGPGGRPPRPELGRHHGPSVRPDALRRRLDGVRGGLRAKGIHPLRRPPRGKDRLAPLHGRLPRHGFARRGDAAPLPHPQASSPCRPRGPHGAGRLGESPDRTGGGGRRDGAGTPFPPRPTPLPPSAAGREAHAPSRASLESGGVTPRRHGPPAGGRP